jgi:hypothetical protein
MGTGFYQLVMIAMTSISRLLGDAILVGIKMDSYMLLLLVRSLIHILTLANP